MPESYTRFRDISVSERILNTVFLLTVGLGNRSCIARVAVVIPFAAMLLDILSWFITKSIPSFAYVVVASGALMGISMGLQILLIVYQMWFYARDKD
ncbi:MAG: hypothetical protein Q8L15_11305 [Methylobacter sp.]|nr:hypothetical protein [Methylobacter sp.]